MWHLVEDFLAQSLVMKAIIGWGWLAIIVMVASLVTTVANIAAS